MGAQRVHSRSRRAGQHSVDNAHDGHLKRFGILTPFAAQEPKSNEFGVTGCGRTASPQWHLRLHLAARDQLKHERQPAADLKLLEDRIYSSIRLFSEIR